MGLKSLNGEERRGGQGNSASLLCRGYSVVSEPGGGRQESYGKMSKFSFDHFSSQKYNDRLRTLRSRNF